MTEATLCGFTLNNGCDPLMCYRENKPADTGTAYLANQVQSQTWTGVIWQVGTRQATKAMQCYSKPASQESEL